MAFGRPDVARRRQVAALIGVLIAGLLHVAPAAAAVPPFSDTILADNGSQWFFSGTSDSRWDDEELNELKSLRGSDFEVVDTTGLVNGP